MYSISQVGGLEYSVSVSLDGSNWTEVRSAAYSLTPRVQDIATAKAEVSFSSRSVRYIKVNITNSTGIATALWRTLIREIEAGDANLPLSSWGITNIQVSSDVPNRYHLFQNYPNPFNPSTEIAFTISKTSRVILTIYDALGRVQDVLVNREKPPGVHRLQWSATNAPTGVYFYRLQAGEFVATKKMVIIR
jgi:hypothetical protein